MTRLNYFMNPAALDTPVSGAAAGQSEPHSAPGRVPPRVGAGDGTAAGPCAPAPGPAAPMTAVSRSPQGPQGRDTALSGTGAESPPRSVSVQPGGSPRQPGVTAAPAIPVCAGAAVTQTPPEDAPDQNAPSGGTTWEITLPAGLRLLSLNGREHWAERARTYKSLKAAAWAMTLNARIPRLRRIAVTVVYDPPDRRHRDPDNLGATLKPLIDGLVATGKVIPADDSRYVASAGCEISDRVYPLGRIRILIREAHGGDS